MVAAGRLGMRLLPECLDPCCQAPAAKNAETGVGGELGTQYSDAQLLVAGRGVRRRDDQAGVSLFFSPTSGPPFGPRRLGRRPASPTSCNAL